MAQATKTLTRQRALKNVAAPMGEGHRVSTTNMVEARPRDRKAKANGANKGALGAALAATFITAIETLGRAIEGNRTSRKDKLREVLALDKPSLTAFHKAMMDRSDAVTAAMEEEKKTNPLVKGLREYFELHPGMETVYVETSMWKKLALAIDAGWKPEVDKVGAFSQTWPNLTASATAAREAVGKPSTDPANPNRAPSSTKRQGRAASTPQSKAVTAVTRALVDEKGTKLAKNNRNLTAVIEGILDADGGATLDELQSVAAMISKKLDAMVKAQEVLDKAKAPMPAAASTQGKEVLAENQTKTTQGATVTKVKAPVKTGTPAKTGSKADALIAAGKELTAQPQAKGERRYSNGRKATA